MDTADSSLPQFYILCPLVSFSEWAWKGSSYSHFGHEVAPRIHSLPRKVEARGAGVSCPCTQRGGGSRPRERSGQVPESGLWGSGLTGGFLTCRKVLAQTRKCSCRLRLCCRGTGPRSQCSLKHSASGHFWGRNRKFEPRVLPFWVLKAQASNQKLGEGLIPSVAYQNLWPRGGRTPAWSVPSLQVVWGLLRIQLEKE